MSVTVESAVLHRSLKTNLPRLVGGKGNCLELEDGRKIFDASGGAAVACIGHGNSEVQQAIIEQISQVSYCLTSFYTTEVCEKLCQELVDSTRGLMKRAYIINSGSEAMEAAMKLARQYYLEKSPPEPGRTQFISRHHSYHGATLGALSMGGHSARRAQYEPMLLNNVSKVSRCFAYRDKKLGESDEAFVARLAVELDLKFQSMGTGSICAFVAEPVVGAALGCVPAVSGYLKAMKAVCDKYGALLILDEVMCGIGRTGTFHAWEQEDVVPDIQTLGKCLGGGYQPIAGVLVGNRVVDVFEKGSGIFMHGQTYQGHPVICAAALAVQQVIRRDRLVQNVAEMGAFLSHRLKELLGDHPNVGNIRGRGLFWAIEFVADRESKKSFPCSDNVAVEFAELGLREDYCLAVYPCSGMSDGVGDSVIVSPAYNVTREDIEKIASTLKRMVNDFFWHGEFNHKLM